MSGQSDPLFVPASLLTKTPTPSTDDPAQEDQLQKYIELVERLSQQNSVIKICTTTERLDPRKHQNWTRAGSCNLLLAR